MVAFNKKTEGGKQVSSHLSPRGNRTSSGQVHSAWVGVSAPLSAPTSLSATPVNTSVSISFTAPENNGGMDITNYQYAISSNGGSSYSAYAALSPADGVSPITVSGLTQNTAYLIKLKAVNDVGISDIESSPISFTTQGIPTSAPTTLSSVQTDTSVAISFTAAASSTSLTNYEYSFNNSTWTALSPADAVSPITISGLSQNTAYNIYLRGVNSYGSGPGSIATSFTTFGPPTGTTTITSVSSISRTTATVNFTTTAGGSAITGYDYYLSSWVDAGVSSSPKNLTGLTASTAYTVYMRPKNAYGIGSQSAGVAFTTLASTLTVQTLVVGGGGNGGSGTGSGGGGGGGGGGGMGQVQTSAQGAGSYTITVGGVSGQSVSYFSGSTIVGNGGSAGSNANGNLGGNGGAGGSGTTYTGGTGGKSGDGGAQGAAGGNGTACAIWGVSATFGGAGGGGSGTSNASGGSGGGGYGGRGQNAVGNPGENGGAGTQYGAGGGGGGYAGASGGGGLQGIVYVSYLTSAAAGMSVTGGSISTNGVYTVHTYTGSSSFTVTLV